MVVSERELGYGLVEVQTRRGAALEVQLAESEFALRAAAPHVHLAARALLGCVVRVAAPEENSAEVGACSQCEDLSGKRKAIHLDGSWTGLLIQLRRRAELMIAIGTK